MTREEAIKELSEWLDDYCGWEELREAVGVAISALKAQNGTDTNVGSNGDTIDRQAAIGEVKKHYRAYDNDLLELITFDIEHLPSAQPERKKGRWAEFDSDEDKFDIIKCSCCKHTFTVDSYHWTDIGFVKDDFNFCPNCGADMRGEQNG